MQDNILFTPHFALLEFTESATARKYGIDNAPTPEIVENIRSLCVNTLEPLREALGQPVIITSGYRSKALNDILSHAVKNSQHLKGQAADFYVGWGVPENGRGQSGDHCPSARERLIKAFRLIITDKTIDYDQLILYPTFIHVSYASPTANRHKILVAKGTGRYKSVNRDEVLSIQ